MGCDGGNNAGSERAAKTRTAKNDNQEAHVEESVKKIRLKIEEVADLTSVRAISEGMGCIRPFSLARKKNGLKLYDDELDDFLAGSVAILLIRCFPTIQRDHDRAVLSFCVCINCYACQCLFLAFYVVANMGNAGAVSKIYIELTKG